MQLEQQFQDEMVYLTKAQFALVNSRAKFPAFVGGLGSGKTEALTMRNIKYKTDYPTCNTAYYMPTFDLIRKVVYPRFEERLTQYETPYRLNKQLAELDVEGAGKIIFRTMDNPARIIGYEVADSFVDELDSLKTDDAKTVWTKILARNRQKKPDGSRNTIAVGTTPEGFRFVYERWFNNAKAKEEGYELIRASTYTNRRNLPDDYIQNLLTDYPSNLVDAYINGNFVNMKSGTVYSMYDRKLNGSVETIKEEDTLHIGMDFNVTKMAAIIHVIRNGNPHAVKELLNVFDTPAMIRMLKERFPNFTIFVYPDASGNSRKTDNASQTDISLLRGAKFIVMANSSNPPVRDRVLSMQAMFCSGEGKRRYFVNCNTCPKYAATLEQQSYDSNGEPDKSNNLDHPNDAGGYFIHYKYPLIRQTSQRMQIVGV